MMFSAGNAVLLQTRPSLATPKPRQFPRNPVQQGGVLGRPAKCTGATRPHPAIGAEGVSCALEAPLGDCVLKPPSLRVAQAERATDRADHVAERSLAVLDKHDKHERSRRGPFQDQSMEVGNILYVHGRPDVEAGSNVPW